MSSISFSPEKIHDDLEGYGIKTLRNLVLESSETRNLKGVNLVQEQLAKEFSDLGLKTQQITILGEGSDARGSLLVAGTVSGFLDGAITLVSHIDTVHKADSPFSKVFEITLQDGQRIAHGPGALDLKGATVEILLALRELRRLDLLDSLPLRIIINPAEEGHTAHSTQAVLDAARGSSLALVFEFARNNPEGKPLLIVARPGVINFEVVVAGQGGHIRESRSLVSAAELGAVLSSRLFQLARATDGLSFNLYTTRGDTAKNVLPNINHQGWEIRALSEEVLDTFIHDAEVICAEVTSKLSIGAPLNPPRLQITGRAPSLSGGEETQYLARTYAESASRVGVSFMPGPELGGLSDANILQELGIPIIDGLGASGAGAHTEREFVHIEDIGVKALCFLEWLHSWVKEKNP